MKESLIHSAYEVAKERYAELGIDTEKVIAQLQDFHLSMHCWQADDVHGFEPKAGAMSGGIQSTGDYPGAARNIDELRADILKAKSLIPGTHRLNLHEIYGEFNGKFVLIVTDASGETHYGVIQKLTPRECWRLQGFSDQ